MDIKAYTEAVLYAIIPFVGDATFYRCDIEWLIFYLSNTINFNHAEKFKYNCNDKFLVEDSIDFLKNKCCGNVGQISLSDFLKKKEKELNANQKSNLQLNQKICAESLKNAVSFIKNILKNVGQKLDFSDCNCEYKSGMAHPNLIIFIVILITLLKNDIKIEERIKVYFRLRYVFDTNFKRELHYEYGYTYLNEFKGNLNVDRFKRVVEINKYIFDTHFNQDIENSLFIITSELYSCFSQFNTLITNTKEKVNRINYSNINITKEYIKNIVFYWLLGYEHTAVVTREQLGNKYENFYCWLEETTRCFTP